jgi:hypothetical protein
MKSQGRPMNCNECSTLVGDADNDGSCGCGGRNGKYGNCLQLSLNFTMNHKVALEKKTIKN